MILLDWNQQVEVPGFAPSIVFEVAIQSENVPGMQLVSHLDQASIGEIDGGVGVLTHKVLDSADVCGKLKTNLEHALLKILQYSLGRS
jgi:hypothetical protein